MKIGILIRASSLKEASRIAARYGKPINRWQHVHSILIKVLLE
jgi:hypothetical protein